MSSEKKSNAVSLRKGYRWRNELVDRLLPYVKDEIEPIFPNKRELLNNMVRGYVPVFFPTRIEVTGGARWLFPLSLTKPHYWWKKEVEDVGREFAECTDQPDDRTVKTIFKKYGWKVEEPVEGISVLDKRGRWRYDAYKDRIAVEVELSSRTQVFKDVLKFLIGQAMWQIDVGIIMVRERLQGKGKPYLGSVERDSHAIYTTLSMLKVAFYGFPSKA